MHTKPLNAQLFICSTELWPEPDQLSSWALIWSYSWCHHLVKPRWPRSLQPNGKGPVERVASRKGLILLLQLFSLSASSLRVLVSCNITAHCLKLFMISFFYFELFVTGIKPVASPTCRCPCFISAFLAFMAYQPYVCSFLQTKVRIKNCSLSLISFSKAWPCLHT